jgi:glutathione synthase/RimK-type ligase-like ATP-grasp enzyme
MANYLRFRTLLPQQHLENRLMILIITNPLDEHADLVCSHLDQQQKKYLRMHPETFPNEVSLTFKPGTWLLNSQISQTAGVCPPQAFDLSRVSAVWFRRPQSAELPAGCSAEEVSFARKEWQHVLRCVYHKLRNRRWLNDPDQIARAEDKPEQLEVAGSLGLRIPRSIVTNDPLAAISFFDDIDGEVIYKQLSGYFYLDRIEGRGYSIYTNVISRKDLLDRADSIRLAPCLLQEYVDKSKELRVTIVGTTIFATEIDSQASERSRVDWRHYDIPNTPYRQVEIPSMVGTRLIALLKHFSLSFGCIDMIVTPTGEYVFLELNANGQWQWIEKLTGQPISMEIAKFLSMGDES